MTVGAGEASDSSASGKGDGFGRSGLSGVDCAHVLGKLLLLEEHNLLPTLLPATIADEIAQGQHRAEVLLGSAHPGPLRATLHHDLVPTLGTTRTDGIAAPAKVSIVEHQ